MSVRAALLQMTSSDDPADNLRTVSDMLRDARANGARFALTPEVTNCVSTSARTVSSICWKLPRCA